MNREMIKPDGFKGLQDRSALLLVLLLLSTDVAFIVMHTVDIMVSSFHYPLLSLEMDRGFPEMFQYIKWFWIIILLEYISTSRRSMHYVSWGLFFTYLLLDDALKVHEEVGKLLTQDLTFSPPLGLRLQDLGEMAVAATAGIVLLSLVGLAYRRGSLAFKKLSIDLLLLMVLLAFCGVLVDAIHVITCLSTRVVWEVNAALLIVEDGGEMFIASLMLWYVYRHSLYEEEHPVSFIDQARAAIKQRRSA